MDYANEINSLIEQADVLQASLEEAIEGIKTRKRTQTTKGKEFRLDQLRNKYRLTARAWKRSVNRTRSIVSHETDVELLKNEGRNLQVNMDELTKIKEELESIIESEEERIDLLKDYDDISRENFEMVKHLHEKMIGMNGMQARENEDRGQSAQALKSEREELERVKQRTLEEIEKRRQEVLEEERRMKENLKKIEEQIDLKLKLMEEKMSHPGQEQISSTPTEGCCEQYIDEQIQQCIDDQQEGADYSRVITNSSPRAKSTPNRPYGIGQTEHAPDVQDHRKAGETQINPYDPPFASARPRGDHHDPPLRQNANTTSVSVPQEAHSYPKQGESSQDSTVSQGQLLEVVKLLAENQSRLPLPEPSIFYGGLLEYPSWVKAFETLVEGRATRPRERLHFLSKYVGGEAKEVVDGFLLLDSEDAYLKAKEMLAKRYGDPFSVASAYRKKLDEWPKIHPTDSKGLRKYADYLVQCEKAMEKINNLNVLNDDQENRRIASKLPRWLIDRWGRTVYQWKEEKGRFPPFSVFVKFLVREADIACDPIISVHAMRGDHDEPRQASREIGKPNRFKFDRRKPSRASGAFATSTSQEVNMGMAKVTSKEQSCLNCNDRHDIEACSEFLEKTIKERKEVARRKGLCFKCLARGHLSKDCKTPRSCRTCNKPHPTSLHADYKGGASKKNEVDQSGDRDTPKRADEIQVSKADRGTSHCLTRNDEKGQYNSMIVPVWLHHSDEPERRELIYALLDDQSDTTFVKETTLKKLEASGIETQLLLSTMHAESEMITCQKVKGLVVSDLSNQISIPLPKAYTRKTVPARRNQIPTPDSARQWPHTSRIANRLMPYRDDVEIALLIGSDCTRAIIPREIISGDNNEPYAQRTDLGWGIIGNIRPSPPDEEWDPIGVSHRLVAHEVVNSTTRIINPNDKKTCLFSVKNEVRELINPLQVRRLLEADFFEKQTRGTPLSQDDRKFLTRMEENIWQAPDGHYQMPLPFRESEPRLQNNKTLALRRLSKLKSRLENDSKQHRDYTSFMNDLIGKGYAEKVPQEDGDEEDKVWYIPHHAVYNPQKPDKVRVVFDCSAKYNGHSLNEHLLQGPDMTNGLVGVLCRFRQEQVAFSCDIESMFHQFRVDEHHRNFLRFLWWEDGDTTKEPATYRMTVHLFGAASSPGCANYGLKKTADDYEEEIGSEAANFIRRNFYVDDGLKSVAREDEAIKLIQDSQLMCAKGGLRLHKFTSNSKRVIQSVLPADRSKELKELDLLNDTLPVERTLGLHWCVETDTFQFRIILQDRPLTRRGILATVSSVYDPLGFVAPVLLVGRQILQELCEEKSDWDDPVPETLRVRWEGWRRDLTTLKDLKIQRCYRPADFGEIKSIELHHFSDASYSGYGQCSYLRLVNENDEVHCSFIMGKARVIPLKPMTIPRLELTAALTSVRISTKLQEELEYSNITEFYWTDSQVVLGYIRNDARRFHVFVSNRVQQIRDHSSPDQWSYVRTNENPADAASRGITARELVHDSRWLTGPNFLWKAQVKPLEEQAEVTPVLSDDDPEVKKESHVFSTSTKEVMKFATILERLERFSSWHKAKTAVALCLRYINKLRDKASGKNDKQPPQFAERTFKKIDQSLTVEELRQAENKIIKLVQVTAYSNELRVLRSLKVTDAETTREKARRRNKSMKKCSQLYRLDPFVDADGILRVGGRIRRANVSNELKHPIILPRKGHVTQLVIRHHHEIVEHQGRGITMNQIRATGVWIIGGNSAVAQYLYRCVKCRKLRGSVQEQRMADLHTDRVEPSPPFTFCAVDYFGPWTIKERRKEMKRYRVLFTCMASRAVHLETANALDTDAFINALRRFIARRGPVRQIRSDQGTNFVGAKGELKDALEEMDQSKIHRFLLEKGCDWTSFKMNVPAASHMGGAWERQIRTTRNVLNSMLENSGQQLDDESLRTFLCEAEAIINCRPLTTDTVGSPDSLEPLTPNHLLTSKSRLVLPPPGEFQRADMYLKRRWRRVQFLANEFWNRWKGEFLQSLQQRQKWTRPRRNLRVNDVVIIKDEGIPRNQWRLGRVEETYPDEEGTVRKVRLAVGNTSTEGPNRKARTLERPVQKLVLLVAQEE